MLGPVDAAIYRALFRDSEARFWGSRAVVDPRVSLAEVSRRTGIARTTVQARFSLWRRGGFWLGHEVWANPALFGARVATVDLAVESPSEVDRLMCDLSEVEGVLSARDLQDEGGRTVRVHLVDDGPRELARRLRHLRRLAVTGPDPVAQPFWVPRPARELSGLDWRVVACYRTFPGATLTEAAASLGITPKTLAQRRSQLVEQNALWWMLNTNTSKFPTAAFYLRLRDPALREEVKSRLLSEVVGWIPCADDGFGRSPGPELDMVAGLALVETPASVDDVARRIAGVSGVAAVRWRIPRRFRSYPDWLDRQLRAQMTERTLRTIRTRVPDSPRMLDPLGVLAAPQRGPRGPGLIPPTEAGPARPN